MALAETLPLGAWENFYVIVGSSGGALTGLTFIVITVAADALNIASTPAARLRGMRAFITPTTVHFGAVLWLAALASIPGHTPLSLALFLAATGVLGSLYCLRVLYLMVAGINEYRPFLDDWIWSAVLPLGSYLSLVAAAILLRAHVALALYSVAGCSLLLLLLGIHNAWDVVVWITTERHARKRGPEAKAPPAERPRA